MLGKRRLVCHVVFHGSILGGFWTFAAAPGWRHCLLLVTIYFPSPNVFAQRYTMRFEPTAWGLDLDVIWRKPEDVVADYVERGVSAVVKIERTLPPVRTFSLRGLISCVSVLKAALALDDWRVITPYGLYQLLLREGGEIIHLEDGDDGGTFHNPENGSGQGDTGSTGGGRKADV